MKVLFLLLLVMSYTAIAQDEVKLTYMNFLSRVEKGDNYASILRMYLKDDAVVDKNAPLVVKTMSQNPQVTDWAELVPGTLISLYITEDVMDTEKYISKQMALNTKMEEVKKIILNKIAPPHGLKGSIFYMASSGNFSQVQGKTSIEYKQNSFGTLGIQLNYFPKNSLFSISSSAYVSAFSDAKAALEPFEVKIPPELGINLYGDFLWKKPRISFYGGIDYEKFSAFNIDGIVDEQKIYLDKVSAIYLTAGASHALKILEKPLFFKVSISQSVNSSHISDYSKATNLDPYSGSKLLFYLNYKFTDKFFLHTLLKVHTMSGPSDLSSTRLGVGVGYILF